MYHSMINNKVTVETKNNEIDTNIKRTPTDYAFFF